MTDFGRRSGVGDMLKSVYDTNDDSVVDAVIAHKTSHQNGGDDEISLAGLAIDPHAASHQNGGTDEIVVTGLIGAGGYVDRGDPDAFDWVVGDLVTDNTWNELDCSGVVPVGTTGIVFNVGLYDDAAGSLFRIRKKGNSNVHNAMLTETQVNGVGVHNRGTVACDADRKCEYIGTDLAFLNINIVIAGWFI